jgi:hypothetical protein
VQGSREKPRQQRLALGLHLARRDQEDERGERRAEDRCEGAAKAMRLLTHVEPPAAAAALDFSSDDRASRMTARA